VTTAAGASETIRILIVGHGRMGRLVDDLASSYGCEVVARIGSQVALAGLDAGAADVAIDFSTGSAVRATVEALAACKIDLVLGTTGWQADEPAVRRIADAAGIGVIASANFAVGMHIFARLVSEAAARFAARPDAGAWIHETHHAAKKDAPSGTALMLQSAMAARGYQRPVDVASTRAGSFPGTHAVGFDTPSESVTLTHVVRDRAVFARGALEAARWVRGRHGWFTMEDML
jgi:4-hydroxy-tetrahydrodipicolinate reductase